MYLALKLLSSSRAERLFHASYELVRLPEGRMSGRRGRYVLADDLYEELKEAVHAVMEQKVAHRVPRGVVRLWETICEVLKRIAVNQSLRVQYVVTGASTPAGVAAPAPATAATAASTDDKAEDKPERIPVRPVVQVHVNLECLPLCVLSFRSADFFAQVEHEVSTACMKYALLSSSSHNVITFNMAKVCSGSGDVGNGPCLRYMMCSAHAPVSTV